MDYSRDSFHWQAFLAALTGIASQNEHQYGSSEDDEHYKNMVATAWLLADYAEDLVETDARLAAVADRAQKRLDAEAAKA